MIRYHTILKFSFEVAGPGGIRSTWDHDAMWEQGGGVQVIFAYPLCG